MKQSKYSAFNVRTSKGSWRQLTLRINEAKEILAIVIFDKQDLSDVKHLIIHILLRISTIFINIKGRNSPGENIIGRLFQKIFR